MPRATSYRLVTALTAALVTSASAQRLDAKIDTRVAVRSGVIETSLFGAADAIGLPDAITLALADAFSFGS